MTRAVYSIEAPPRAANQDVFHPPAYRGRVAVSRQIDQAGEIAPVRIAPDEHPDLAALLEVGDLLHHGGQLGHRGLEQLVAGIGLQHVHDRLAAMAGLAVARARDHRSSLLPQHRHPGHAL